eukprot:SAG25_NODE_1192_length_3655_cov_5.906637_3_plen_149_part_00
MPPLLMHTYALCELLCVYIASCLAFQLAGHIAHLNLRDEQLPFKELIGQVVLDKNTPRIRTVLNKIGTITNEFRVFAHEVLVGEKETKVLVKEGGCTFRFDFGKVTKPLVCGLKCPARNVTAVGILEFPTRNRAHAFGEPGGADRDRG